MKSSLLNSLDKYGQDSGSISFVKGNRVNLYMWEFFLMSEISRLDDKGRILIPAKIRKKPSSKVVRIRMEDNKIVIEPVRDPIERLVSSVKRGTKNVAKEIRSFRKIAEKMLEGGD